MKVQLQIDMTGCQAHEDLVDGLRDYAKRMEGGNPAADVVKAAMVYAATEIERLRALTAVKH